MHEHITPEGEPEALLIDELRRAQTKYNEWARNATPQERAAAAREALRHMPGQAYLFAGEDDDA